MAQALSLRTVLVMFSPRREPKVSQSPFFNEVQYLGFGPNMHSTRETPHSTMEIKQPDIARHNQTSALRTPQNINADLKK